MVERCCAVLCVGSLLTAAPLGAGVTEECEPPSAPEIHAPKGGEILGCTPQPPVMVALVWERVPAANPESEPVLFDVYYDGEKVEEEVTHESTIVGADCETAHSWRVVARNPCGSAGASASFSVGACSDSYSLAECYPPVADFTWSPTDPAPGEEVHFTASAETEETALEVHWYFGDGAAALDSSVTHAYEEPGAYEVRMEAHNDQGSDSTTKTVTVGAPAAEIEISGPATAETGEEVVVQASATGCQPASTGWSWGLDGGRPVGAAGSGSVTVTWDQPGSKRVTASNSACHDAVGEHLVTLSETPDPVITISAPLTAVAGEPVALTASATGCDPVPGGWSWSLEGGTLESGTGTERVTATWDEVGTFRVSARTDACGDASGSHTLRVEAGDLPRILRVVRQLPGFFLDGTVHRNRFDVEVEWNGEPGEVRFLVDGERIATAPGDETGASQSFRMDRFEPSFEPTVVEIVAVRTPGDEGGVELPSEPVEEELFVFPHPAWLDDVLRDGTGFLQSEVVDGAVVYRIGADYPDPHLAADGPVEVPRWVPVLGGRLGLTETFVRVDGEASSTGLGDFELFGQTGFVAAGDSLDGEARGGGTFRIFDSRGLVVTTAGFDLSIDGSIHREMGLLDALPVLRRAESLPGIGKSIRRINRSATLSTRVEPGLGFGASFAQDDAGELAFTEARGHLEMTLRAGLEAEVGSRVTLSAYLAGSGRFDLAAPEPFVRRIDFWAEVGASANVDLLFEIEEDWSRRFGCTWEVTGGFDCGERASESRLPLLRTLRARDLGVRPMRRDYRRFGRPAELRDRLVAESGGTPARAVERTELIRNVFPGASPAYLLLERGEMVLWEHQDAENAIRHSLDIAWSLKREGTWSEPELVADDDRLELSPVAAVDPEGRVVAAWLRTGDEAPQGPIRNLADLGELYRHLEVVTAVFDPGADTWSDVTPLTDDRHFDDDLQLAADGEGRLLLTWISNPDAGMASAPEAPSQVRFSLWDPEAGRWSSPSTVAAGLVGTVGHASAIRGDEALVVVEREVPDDSGDLALFRWDGQGWREEPALFTGTSDDRSPRLVYDASGEAQALWIRDGELVHSALEPLEPVTIRSGGGSLGLLDSLLAPSLDGSLVLVWPEVGELGSADVTTLVFDPEQGRWSEPRSLDATAAQVREIDGIVDRDGRLRVAFVSTEIGRRDETVEIDGSPQVIRGLPEEGRSDLRTLVYRPVTDLALDGADLEVVPHRPRPGDAARADLLVHNSGDFAVRGFDVELYAGEPRGGGLLLASARVTEVVAGGGTVQSSLPFTYPTTGGDLVVLVDSADEVTEVSESNNRAVLSPSNRPPEARVDASPTSGRAPLRVELEAGASTDPDGDSLHYRWTFSDGEAAATSPKVTHVFTEAGTYSVAVRVSDGHLARLAFVEIEVEPGEDSDPPPPPGEWLSSSAVPDFDFKVRISGGGGSIPGSLQEDCIPETLCVAGAVSGRSEAFLRIAGPKPNGFLWPTLVKFTTSIVEVWVRQATTGVTRFYRLEGARPGTDELPGLFDREGFTPNGEAVHTLETEGSPPPPTGEAFTSEELPDFRFRARITAAGAPQPVRRETGCIEETLCLSGAIPGRSEVFVRIVGPKPNGHLWPTIVKLTTSEVEVWIEQVSTGETRYYRLEGAAPGTDELTGLFDRTGFLPSR